MRVPMTSGRGQQEARAHASFYESDGEGNPAGLYRVDSEGPIEVAPEAGALWYDHSERFAQYEGDRQGPVPDEFPKGFDEFYVMKHEITQGQYCDFLNTIPDGAAGHRAIHAGRAYQRDGSRGTIRLNEDGVYVADAPERPANFISWDDGCAFADWAGLRPMTELEFTKACRGPEAPQGLQYPWGTDNKDDLLRVLDTETLDLVAAGAAHESILSEDTRATLGASYWWVMDLAGSVWERCVTIGHPAGRAFRGTHGDGRLSGQGFATNDDWPAGDNGGPGGGGYGYRGGGYYERERQYDPAHFNPHSPVAWRRFGSWGEAPRHIAYGFRCARTAD